jgi:hypothetical protein
MGNARNVDIDCRMPNEFCEELLEDTIREAVNYTEVVRRPASPGIPCDSTMISPLLRRVKQCIVKNDREGFGVHYNRLLNGFDDLVEWAVSCWDYLVTTEGCRFLERQPAEKQCHRGDYRAFDHKDYSRLVYRMFKEFVISYKGKVSNFASYVGENFWNRILAEYRNLENPADERQRKLTGYSYLRCIPYQFLNDYHHIMVYCVLQTLPRDEQSVVQLYFLSFFTEETVAKMKLIEIAEVQRYRDAALRRIRSIDPLVYALLRQIERY